jgi:hypothetical protein
MLVSYDFDPEGTEVSSQNLIKSTYSLLFSNSTINQMLFAKENKLVENLDL